ncbi:hypothetical protein GCM10010123_38890 [Pilimelia anulata]|uniref:Uncharacterized protein n=1 Tax=Pilimelia anulata TaxID=53371 RepID=A0A8J3FFK0_9ACTN|nr:permease [Pilimelia anulata]GGK05263.1 hypothetical protein GCM10010123_38890 [Pilimelia anulata]
MRAETCPTCGRAADPTRVCPHCGAVPGSVATALADVEREIAELAARDVSIQEQRTELSQRMQAAMHRRALLANAQDLRQRHSATARATARRRRLIVPPRHAARPPEPPPGPSWAGAGRPRVAPLADAGRGAPKPGRPPEASSYSVQTVLLVLGALLLAVSATVFAGLAISTLGGLSRAGILIVVAMVTLSLPPRFAARGLTATAETVAGVGLLLVPLVGSALWAVDAFWSRLVSGHVYAALVFAATACVAAGYAAATGLAAPRYATLLAVQPVLPLAAYPLVTGDAGWAAVFTAVAVVDLVLARALLTTLSRWARVHRPAPPAPRPEGAPEEPDAVVTGPAATGRSGAPPAPAAGDVPDRPAARAGNEPGAPAAADSRRRAAGTDGRAADATPRGGGTADGGWPAAADGATLPADRTAPLPDRAAARADGGSRADDPAGDGSGAPGDPRPGRRVLYRTGWLLHLAALCLAFAAGTSALARAATPGAALAGALALALTAGVAVAGAVAVRSRSGLPDAACGLLAFVLVAGFARFAAVALPGRALIAGALLLAVAGAALHVVPARRRAGPRLGAAAALVAVGALAAAAALHGAAAALAAVRPAWRAPLDGYRDAVAAAAPAGSALLLALLLLAVATALIAPPGWRREWTGLPVALAALAAPAALALPWPAAPWPAVIAAVGLAAAACAAPRPRAAYALGAAGLAAAAFAAGTAVARPDLTAAVLGTLTCAGLVLVAGRRAVRRGDSPLSGVAERAAPGDVPEWVGGATILCAAGAVAAVLSAGGASPPARLTGAALVVCAGLVVAAFAQVRRRTVSLPLCLAAGLGGLGVTIAAVRLDGAGVIDAAIGVLLILAAVALPAAPLLDERLRSDRRYDGSDLAAAVAIAATIATLARTAALAAPHAQLLAAAAFVLLVACVVRAVPAEWQRGAVLGLAGAGGVLALWVAAITLYGGLRVLATPGPLWHSDLAAWPGPGPADWQAPLAAVLLAVAAALALPRPASYDAAAGMVGLATIAAPAAFGLPWWSPIVIDGIVATGYAIAAVAARDPRAGRARAVVGTAVALHAVAAGLVRPWTTAAALALLALLGAIVAVAGHGDVRRRMLTGGGVTVALVAAPAAVACAAASLRLPVHPTLVLGLLTAAAGLVVVAAARRRVPHYLPYASAGIAGGATAIAVAALPTGRVALYAALAVLLGVLAELVRQHTPAPSTGRYGASRRWLLRPPMGALAAAALPGLLATAVLLPPLWAALTDPAATLDHIWAGPPPELLALSQRTDVTPADVLATLVLTVAATLAAIGFSEGHAAEAAPVVLPGLGLTLLLAPLGLHLPWPATTLAGLVVFTVLMLGVALLPPPPSIAAAQPVRVGRVVAFVLGLAAGGAGLTGSLATEPLTLTTLAGAVGVGLVAGFAGKTPLARILGWLFAAVSAQALALTAGLAAGWPRQWSAFGVLAAGAGLLIVAATLPRLGRPGARNEARAVEWSGYAAAALALALALGSTPHVAAVLAGWGAVLGLAATRRNRSARSRRALFWTAIGCEVVAWWLLMGVADVATVEAYTLPFAALALLVGVLEARQQPDLSSWVAYGPALISAFVPSLVIVLTAATPVRQVILLLAAVATLILGSIRQKRAPVVVGAVVTTITALHALVQFGPWLVLLPVGVLLLWFGATNERRRRDVRRLRGAVRRMT